MEMFEHSKRKKFASNQDWRYEEKRKRQAREKLYFRWSMWACWAWRDFSNYGSQVRKKSFNKIYVMRIKWMKLNEIMNLWWSGSGKTSLLNALNFSTKPPLTVHGRVMINGCDANSTRMAMISRYVQQDDLFFGTLTVKEHLTFHVCMYLAFSESKNAY